MDYHSLPHFVPRPFNDIHEMRATAKRNDLEFAANALFVTATLIAVAFGLMVLVLSFLFPLAAAAGGITLA